jgi:hypothetical protein
VPYRQQRLLDQLDDLQLLGSFGRAILQRDANGWCQTDLAASTAGLGQCDPCSAKADRSHCRPFMRAASSNRTNSLRFG